MVEETEPARRLGALLLVVASSAVVGGLGAAASLRFPEVLLDDPSFGASLVAATPVAAVAGLVALLTAGVALVGAARRVAGRVPATRRQWALVTGVAGGVCWAVGATIGLALLALWRSDAATALAGSCFACAAVAGPLFLAAWTWAVVPALPGGPLAGRAAAAGLLLVAVRSVVWASNAHLPSEHGHFVVSAVLTVLALVGHPVWLYWLARTGRRLRSRGGSRRWRGAAALAGAVLVVAHAVLVVTTTPVARTDAVPAVPSAGGSALYVVLLALSGQLALPTDQQELEAHRGADRFTQPAVPAGARVVGVDAGGVAAERVCADTLPDDASGTAAVLYLHGGGFVLPTTTGHREFAASLSRRTGACVLLPHYATAPEHPFPAAVRDAERAYRWLLDQGVPPARIAVVGDSAGGTLALAAALGLRDAGGPLPAALVALSPGTDLTLSGSTHRTNAHDDGLLSADDVRFSVESYTAGGSVDPRDPLVSPLFADPTGLPPTLLLAGSQEVLLSDATRMAERLAAADVPVRLEVWPGMPHDWPLIAPEIVESELAVRHIAAFLVGAWSAPGPPVLGS